MDLFDTNKSAWERLVAAGRLYSQLKDGKPDTPARRIVGFGYPIILIVLIVVAIVAMVVVPMKQWKWKTYGLAVTGGSIVGWVWGAWMLHYDPHFPAWLYAPWAYVGWEWIMSFEDWLFYPVCTTIFYMFYRVVNIKDFLTPPRYFDVITLSIYAILTLFFLVFSSLAGRTEALMFMAPGMMLYFLTRNSINRKKFIIFQIFVIVFETIWDLTAVSILHYIPGFAWASHWSYIVFDSTGAYTQSTVFLDYATHRWAWILLNPIEITPWFGICGGLLNVVMFTAGDRLFYPQETIKSV